METGEAAFREVATCLFISCKYSMGHTALTLVLAMSVD